MVTDAQRIAAYLEQHGSVTSHEIRVKGLSGNPSQRTRELRDQGYEIDTERFQREGRPCCRYTLIASPRLRRECKSPAGEGIGVSHKVLGSLETVARGSRSEKGTASHCVPATATSGEGSKTPQGGGGTSSVATARPTLFELDVPVGSHYGQDAA